MIIRGAEVGLCSPAILGPIALGAVLAPPGWIFVVILGRGAGSQECSKVLQLLLNGICVSN